MSVNSITPLITPDARTTIHEIEKQLKSNHILNSQVYTRILAAKLFADIAIEVTKRMVLTLSLLPFAAVELILKQVKPGLSKCWRFDAITDHLKQSTRCTAALALIPKISIDPSTASSCYRAYGIVRPYDLDQIMISFDSLLKHVWTRQTALLATTFVAAAVIKRSGLLAPLPATPTTTQESLHVPHLNTTSGLVNSANTTVPISPIVNEYQPVTVSQIDEHTPTGNPQTNFSAAFGCHDIGMKLLKPLIGEIKAPYGPRNLSPTPSAAVPNAFWTSGAVVGTGFLLLSMTKELPSDVRPSLINTQTDKQNPASSKQPSPPPTTSLDRQHAAGNQPSPSSPPHPKFERLPVLPNKSQPSTGNLLLKCIQLLEHDPLGKVCLRLFCSAIYIERPLQTTTGRELTNFPLQLVKNPPLLSPTASSTIRCQLIEFNKRFPPFGGKSPIRRSLKKIPLYPPNAIAAQKGEHLSTPLPNKEQYLKAAQDAYECLRELFKEDRHNITPEERTQKIQDYTNSISAIRKLPLASLNQAERVSVDQLISEADQFTQYLQAAQKAYQCLRELVEEDRLKITPMECTQKIQDYTNAISEVRKFPLPGLNQAELISEADKFTRKYVNLGAQGKPRIPSPTVTNCELSPRERECYTRIQEEAKQSLKKLIDEKMIPLHPLYIGKRIEALQAALAAVKKLPVTTEAEQLKQQGEQALAKCVKHIDELDKRIFIV